MHAFEDQTWSADWAWSLPLIAMNVVIHVSGLGLITEHFDRILDRRKSHRGIAGVFALIMTVTVTLVTILHGVEAAAWALAYRLLGALPNTRAAMLYSLSAMTSYGNSDSSLPNEWRLMGSLEALNGMLLFGLSTAFLFAMIQKSRPVGGRRDRHS